MPSKRKKKARKAKEEGRRESEKKGHVTATSHEKNATKNICEVLHAEQIKLCQFKEGKRNITHWTSTRKLGVS